MGNCRLCVSRELISGIEVFEGSRRLDNGSSLRDGLDGGEPDSVLQGLASIPNILRFINERNTLHV